MSRREKILHFRCEREVAEVLEELAKHYGVSLNKLLYTMAMFWLEFLRRVDDEGGEKFDTTLRHSLLSVLLDIYRKREEASYRAFKSMLRSNEYLTSDGDRIVLDDGTEKRISRAERIKNMLEDPEKREFIEAALNERRYWAEKIKEVFKAKGQLLRKLGEYRTAEELVKENT